MGHWRDVVREQIETLKGVGLGQSPMWVGISGFEPSDFPYEMFSELNVIEWSCHKYLDAFERPTLRMMEKRAKGIDPNTPILYLHTKGVSDPSRSFKEKWRRLMEQHVVVGWGSCIEKLAGGADVVGVNWRTMPPISHFCGNFWWAKAGFVAQLRPIDLYYKEVKYSSNWDRTGRLACEFWLSSGREPVVESLVCRDVDFVKPEVWANG